MAKRGPRRPKAVDGDEPTGAEALRGNGYDPEKTQGFVNSIEEIQAEIDACMSAAADECSPLRERIDEIKKTAHDSGLPRLELNSILSKRKALRRAESYREKLSTEQKDNFDQLELALGMLPKDDKSPPTARPTTGAGVEGHA